MNAEKFFAFENLIAYIEMLNTFNKNQFNASSLELTSP